ncbi:hypothetical protein [Virgibacillus sp. YIM 98842]|jgi:ABC-type Fe3+-siderophore transport system permease subunit|uniref:hypothetical protein n=1 Tax=Virgibacillus sp. YIM 98842 TaxID=2663533 RepID=UPI0013DAB7A6|nr:hypothetical protein [Virgibacillus sp. YIM 98842]
MDWLQTNDFLIPTNPYAALFFGIMFTIIVGIIVWIETKEKKTVLIVFIAGCLVSVIGSTLLHFIGFY